MNVISIHGDLKKKVFIIANVVAQSIGGLTVETPVSGDIPMTIVSASDDDSDGLITLQLVEDSSVPSSSEHLNMTEFCRDNSGKRKSVDFSIAQPERPKTQNAHGFGIVCIGIGVVLG